MKKSYSLLHALLRTKVSMLILCLFLTANVFSQITIGSGTATQRYPFNYWYGFSRDASIYTASEMNTSATAGLITTISWYSNIASTVTGPTVIYLKQVGAVTAVASDTWANTIVGATPVYTGTPPAMVVGWNSIDITDYAIPAGQNLEILVECNVTGGGAGSSTSTAIRFTPSLTGAHAYWQADTDPPASTPSATNNSRSNVILGGLVTPTCFPPTTFTTGIVTSSSAVINWTAPTPAPALGYDYYYSTLTTPPTPATVPSGSVTGTSVTISPLAANTSYYVWVRSKCSASDLSGWSSVAYQVFTGYCLFSSTSNLSYFDAFSTTGGSTNITNNASGYATGGYQNATAMAVTQQQGGVINFATTLVGTTVGVAIWVDWNNDLVFDNATERVFNTAAYVSTATGNFTVPITTTVGNYRMRVVMDYNATSPSPCGTGSGRGEAEDYTVTVIASAPCSGAPMGVTATPAFTTVCGTGGATFAANTTSTGTGFTFQWQSSPSGAGTWTDLSGATNPTLTVTGVTATTDYRVVITCSGSSANSSVATLIVSGVPANDDVCSAVRLTLDGPSQCGNTICATATGDPLYTQSTANNTVWYTYTPTTTGAVQFRFKRPAGVTTGLLYGWLGVYTATGSCPTLTLSEVTGNALGYNLTTTDSVTVTTTSLTAGTNYYFMVDGNSGAFGAFCIQMLTPPPPPLCTTLLAPPNGSTTVDNLFTLRWNKVANATSYDVYIGTTTPPAFAYNSLDTTLSLSATVAGTHFYWYIVPKASTDAVGCNGNIFDFTTRSTPSNDSCGAAIALTQDIPVTGALTGATTSPAASLTCGASTYASANDVWYSITALANGAASVKVVANFGTGFNPVIAAYSGTCSAPVSISCSDATTTTTETLNLTGLVAGNTYLLRVFANGTVSNGGFTITASGPALPVTGITLSALRTGGKVQLGWQTQTEINNIGFELQRSVDGRFFSSIATIASKTPNGNSTGAITYNADDIKPLSGSNYYRLKQIDKDGKTNFSNVAFVKGLPVSNLTISAVYPNPTSDVLKAAIQTPTAQNITFVVTDMAGKVVSRQVAAVVIGDNTININVAQLSSGNYLLKAICNNGCETAYQKFSKQ